VADAAWINERLPAKLAETQCLCGWHDMTDEFMAGAPDLYSAHSISAGVDTFIYNPISRNSRITLTNSRGASAVIIGEYILSTMLMIALHQPLFPRPQTEPRWQRQRLTERYGRTRGIVGLGAIGEGTASRARAFGMRLLAIRRSATEPHPSDLVDRVLPASALPELLAESDYVALTLPLTPETNHLIGEAELRRIGVGEAVRVRAGPQAHEDGDVGQRAEQAPPEHDLLPADAIREAPEDEEERRRDRERDRHEDIGGLPVDLERGLQERQRVKLAGVPDDSLPGGGAEEHQSDDAPVLAASEGIAQRSC